VALAKRIYNIFRYGLGEGARARKRASKNRKRQEIFESELWQHDGQMVQRKYASYDEYVKHQASKLERVAHRLRETEAEDFADFKNRFANCEQLSGARAVLCLGARLGTEVRALHSLGYFAIGIDLNPGEENPYVLLRLCCSCQLAGKPAAGSVRLDMSAIARRDPSLPTYRRILPCF
jgi:hypothetical protein